MDEIRLLEECATNAWPPAEVEPLGGWRLRFNQGVTRRTNSVWPNGWSGDLALEERIETVERFYASRGDRARFQLTPAALPGDLDEILAAGGYEIEDAGVHVQTAPVDPVRRHARRSCDVEISPGPDDLWVRTAWPDPAQRPGVRRAIVERIEPEVACALARLDGEPAGVALGVAERGYVGLFAFHSRPELRRRGVAESLLGALSEWAQRQGARALYLQVEDGNTGARALYARAGFETRYRYHYRSREV